VSRDEPTSPPPELAEPRPANETPVSGAAPATPSGASPQQVRLIIAGVVIAALAAMFWPRENAGAPAATLLIDAAGRSAPVASELAPVTLLHFWSTRCPPCIEETPAITRLARDLGAEPRFKVMMVAVADDASAVAAFEGVAAESVLYDPDWKVANRYGTEQLPETYLLVHGKVTRKFVGATNWDDPQIRAAIRQAIAAAPATAGG
jgi:cytochrome c biogenesis protein CcmG/thiol:disulfide interchange protein DsbE